MPIVADKERGRGGSSPKGASKTQEQMNPVKSIINHWSPLSIPVLICGL